MVSLDFLERIQVFKDLDDRQLTAVQSCCQESEFHRGDKIFEVGEDSTCLWTVMEGTVDLKQDSLSDPALEACTLPAISEAMTFGWSSFLPPHKYRLSAYCSSRRCMVIKTDRPSLAKLFEEDAKMGYLVMSQLLAVLGDRFHQLQEEVIKRRGQDILNQW
jgi:signal-transduction protein with cAMP-binding, CBS, and nucleotidyltransferase domain